MEQLFPNSISPIQPWSSPEGNNHDKSNALRNVESVMANSQWQIRNVEFKTANLEFAIANLQWRIRDCEFALANS